MMKYIFLILGLIITVSNNGMGQENGRTQISLITCGPDYEDPSAMFGHTALRLYDPSRNIDRIYNYGLFDPSDKLKFVKEFVTGNTQYIVGAQKYGGFLEAYQSDNRWVKEQVLDLTPDQKIAIEGFLNNNIKPENREYLYQFFYDNCSTRVKDLLEDILPGYEYINSPIRETTYRQLINEYAQGMDWTDFGIDIIIASPGDEVIDHQGQMFLPDYLMLYMDKFKSPEGKKLVSQTYDVLPIPEIRPKSYWITPVVFFGFLLFLEVLLIFQRKKGISKWIKSYDIVWYCVTALASGLLLFMLTTLHYPCHYNYNLLWLNPLFIPLVVLKFTQPNKTRKWISITIIGVLILTIAAWTMIPQDMPMVGIIIAAISILKLAWEVKRISSAEASSADK